MDNELQESKDAVMQRHKEAPIHKNVSTEHNKQFSTNPTPATSWATTTSGAESALFNTELPAAEASGAENTQF